MTHSTTEFNQPADQPTTPAPCPFCGGDARLIERESDYGPEGKDVACDTDFCYLAHGADWYLTADEAIAKWNTRAASTAVKDERLRIIEGLRVLQSDDHHWSNRPCNTCKQISDTLGVPFGCYEYQRLRGEN